MSWEGVTLHLNVADFLRVADDVVAGGNRSDGALVQLQGDPASRVNLWIGSVGLALNASGFSDLTTMVDEAAELLRLRPAAGAAHLPGPYHRASGRIRLTST